MKGTGRGRRPADRRKSRRLAELNSRISRLSSELETLRYMQDRLERELEADRG